MKSDASHIRLYGLKNKKINLTKTKTNQGSMKFNEFWISLCKKTSGGFESQTLAQKCPFIATYSSGKIIVKPDYKTKEPRPLSSEEFHKVWIIAAKLPKHEIFKRKNYNDSYHGSYIISMMKTILGEEEIEE